MSVSGTNYRAARRERLRESMDRAGVGAAVMRRPANFAWYTGGGNSRVEYAAPEGVADVVVTADHEWILTSKIEAPRMRAEEAPGVEVVEYPWDEGPQSALRELTGDVPLGADLSLVAAGSGVVDLSLELDALRRVLDRDATARLREIGADLTAALAEAAGEVRPGLTEHDVAAAIASACRARGLVPTVLLAATDERIRRHRHPLPAGAAIERRAMLVASAQRGGLYANLTRIVWLDDPDPDTARRQEACEAILARTREEATRAGRSLVDVFDDIRRFYADEGLPDEWRLHHQGGITGYASREVIATPYTDVPVEPGMAFSWNPSITGAKAEDTFVLTEAGPEVVAGAV
jgi:Xaa-Pro dipeptidase